MSVTLNVHVLSVFEIISDWLIYLAGIEYLKKMYLLQVHGLKNKYRENC